MPIYEYQCQHCQQHFDKLQKMSDPELTDCPSCGKAELKKLVSAPRFKLTGTGWYETDFKNKTPKVEGTKAETKDGDAVEKGEVSSASEAKSDTKADVASPTPPPSTTTTSDKS